MNVLRVYVYNHNDVFDIFYHGINLTVEHILGTNRESILPQLALKKIVTYLILKLEE